MAGRRRRRDCCCCCRRGGGAAAALPQAALAGHAPLIDCNLFCPRLVRAPLQAWQEHRGSSSGSVSETAKPGLCLQHCSHKCCGSCWRQPASLPPLQPTSRHPLLPPPRTIERVSMECMRRRRLEVHSSTPTGSVSGLLLYTTGGGAGCSTCLTAWVLRRRRRAASSFSRATASSSSCSLVFCSPGWARRRECRRGLRKQQQMGEVGAHT